MIYSARSTTKVLEQMCWLFGWGKRRDKKKSLLLASRSAGQGKKLEFLAKRGWQIVAEIGPNSEWLGDRDSNPGYLVQSQASYH